MNKDNKYILTYGFAVFAMFFGSGNLVFPLEIGYLSASNWLVGFIGLFLTGILLPFSGLFVIKLHKGNYLDFFGQAGRLAKIILPLFTLSLLGSFAVVPRCIVVAHGGISFVSPGISLFYFSLIFSLTTYFFCLREKFMVEMLGKVMSPIMVLLLVVLLIFGIVNAPEVSSSATVLDSLTKGFTTGYQTMDLFAAFFFSSLIYQRIAAGMPSGVSDKQILQYSIKPAILGSLMLSLIYLGLVFLGAHYRSVIDVSHPQLMLPQISNHLLGKYSTLFIAIAMVFSCFTTAVALNNIYAKYLCDLFKIKETQFPSVLAVTTFMSFLISLADFKGIAAFLTPVLEVTYPGLIALTVISMFSSRMKHIKKAAFWLITFAMIIKNFIPALD